jgi:hypothetical protein
MSVGGQTAFRSDLMRSTVVAADAMFFSKDPYQMSFGQGSVTLAYRPIPFKGTFAVSKVLLQPGFGGEVISTSGKPIEPLPSPDPSASPSAEPTIDPNNPKDFDGMPDVELLDLVTGAWVQLPHLSQGTTYDLVHPERYVDAATGTIQVKFINDRQDGIGFAFNVSLEGSVR